MSGVAEITSKSFAGAWRLVDSSAETSAGRSVFSAKNLQQVELEEFKTAYLGYTSYYGTYTLDAANKTITHHVKGSLAAAWVSGDQVRYFDVADDRLTLKTPPIRVADGTKAVNTLVWERV